MIYGNVSRSDTSIRREISDSNDESNMNMKMKEQSQVSLQLGCMKRKRRDYRRQGPVNDSMISDFICLVNNEFCSESRDEMNRWKVISLTMSRNQQRVVIKPVCNPSTFEIEPSLRRYNSEVPISAALRFRFELTLINTDGLYTIQVRDMIEGRPSGLPLGEGRRKAIINSTERRIRRRCEKIAKVLNGNSSSINDDEDFQKMFHKSRGRVESVMIRPSILRSRLVSDLDDETNARAAVLFVVVCLFGLKLLYNWESVVALRLYKIGTSLYHK